MKSLRFATLAAFSLLAAAWAVADTQLRLVIEGKGTVTIRLFEDKAPKASSHVSQLARSGFYDGQRFHLAIRTPKPYRIQVGDPASKNRDLDSSTMGNGGSGARIPYENSGLSNTRGMVGLSTLPRDRDSGDSQFYILLGDAKFLDGSYTVFGKVIDGMDVVDRIEKGDRISSVSVVSR